MKQIESFFLGIIAALGALILELVFFIGYSIFTNQESNTFFSQLFIIPQLIILGAFIEEIFKYIVISKRVEMLSLSISYIINSFLVGLGFFSIELGLMRIAGDLPPQATLVEIAIIHIGTAGIIGYIVATKNPRKISTVFYALLVTTFLHSSYNILILQRNFIIHFIIYFLLILILLINFINLIRINKKLAQE
jgi:hypothetical protein